MKVEIIGGSMAGLRAAKLLAEKGHEVHVFEARKVGDHKACAEVYFDKYPEVELPPHGHLFEYEHALLSAGESEKILIPGRFIHQYDRSEMEKGLGIEAKEAGVTINENHKKTKPSGNCVTIDASGFPSIFYTPDDYQLSFGVSCFVKAKAETLEMKWTKKGYYWIAPKGDVINVGYGEFAPPFKSCKEEAERYAKEFGEIIKSAGRYAPYNFQGRMWHPESKTVLIGDAAGLCNPFYGAGYHTALLSAQIAADCIHNDALDEYEDRIGGRVRPEMMTGNMGSSFRSVAKFLYT